MMKQCQAKQSLAIPIQLQIDSFQQAKQFTQYVQEDLYYKGKQIYVRYIEPEVRSEQRGSSNSLVEATQVTLKIKRNQIKLIRRGQVEAV